MKRQMSAFVRQYVSRIMLISILLPIHSIWASEGIVMAGLSSLDTSIGQLINLIYTEAFRRLDLELEYRHYPGLRASMMADKGKLDGELTRVYEYAHSHPNLIRVEEPAILTTFSAFSMNSNIQLSGWESLRNTSYRVEYLMGDKRSHDKLVELIPDNKLSAIPSMSQGVKKLIQNRTDLYIGPENIIRPLLRSKEMVQYLKKQSMTDADVITVGTMEKIALYAYLHHKHRAIVPKLSNILKTMKEEGLIEHYQAITVNKSLIP